MFIIHTFERELLLDKFDFTPQLRAAEELKGWSLLSWRGPFVYAGFNIIDPDGRWLPNSWVAVEDWIARIAGQDS